MCSRTSRSISAALPRAVTIATAATTAARARTTCTTPVAEHEVMGAICRMSTALLCSFGFAAAAGAAEFDGRYLGNVFHSEYGGQSTDRTSHLYDIIMRQDTPQAL